ncbi:hypothetical protein [Methylobacterium thuringiense]|nr:hypothetical protein [Methylobacterium thuringiense]
MDFAEAIGEVATQVETAKIKVAYPMAGCRNIPFSGAAQTHAAVV